jgi:hypothetical protein
MAARPRGYLRFFWVTHFALACGVFAQAPVHKIRQKMTASLRNTPDFVCSELIETTERVGSNPPVKLMPLRVEGGVINGKELYVAPATDDEKIRLGQLLAVYGKAGTGSFALYSRDLFFTTEGTFYSLPDEVSEDRRFSRLDFALPREASTYSINRQGRSTTLAYSGSIWIEPGSPDVARLLLKADDIPGDLGIKAVTQSFEFARIKMAGNSVLLPTGMELTLQEISGRETRVNSSFSGCHQYVAKRGDPFVEAAPRPTVVASQPGAGSTPANAGPLLPEKLVLETILAEAIDERSTTQGSKLSFVVTRDVKRKGQVIVPKGATGAGHITRILRQTYPIDNGYKGYYLIGAQLDSVTIGNRQFRFWGNLESLGPPPPPPLDSVGFVPYSQDPNKWGTFDEMKTLFVVPPAESGESFVGIVGEFLRLPKRLVMYWSTQDSPEKRSQP